MANLVETQTFCQYRLNHLILRWGSNFHFQIRWIFRKVRIFGIFRGASYEKLILTLSGKNWKEWTLLCCKQHVVHNIKKYPKMSQIFQENSQNCQNHGLFEGVVIGRRIYPTRWFWSWTLCNYLKFVLQKIHVYYPYTVRN